MKNGFQVPFSGFAQKPCVVLNFSTVGTSWHNICCDPSGYLEWGRVPQVTGLRQRIQVSSPRPVHKATTLQPFPVICLLFRQFFLPFKSSCTMVWHFNFHPAPKAMKSAQRSFLQQMPDQNIFQAHCLVLISFWKSSSILLSRGKRSSNRGLRYRLSSESSLVCLSRPFWWELSFHQSHLHDFPPHYTKWPALQVSHKSSLILLRYEFQELVLGFSCCLYHCIQ